MRGSFPGRSGGRILNGEWAITGETALCLGDFFGANPEFWLNLQGLYEARLAEQKAGKAIESLSRLKRRKGRAERQSIPA